MQPVNKDVRGINTVIRPRPTKASGVTLIIAGALFLLFSALPFGTAEGEARPYVFIFGGVWVCLCLFFIIYGIYIVKSDRPSSGMVIDIEEHPMETGETQLDDFDVRIRKLAKLKEDGLITEEEYQRKRMEIMNRPW